jgi:hypothetical protein
MCVKTAIAPQQFVVRADLDDLPLPHSEDAGAGTDRRQTVGDDDVRKF